MGLENLSAGENVPEVVNVVIEIPTQSLPVKYEIDKASGFIKVDRFLTTSMSYPCEYGFIPHTLSEDGDPVDVLVISPYPLLPGVVIACRPVAMLRMADESGKDAKILAVPIEKLTSCYTHIKDLRDVNEARLKKIEHFFNHYKELEKDRWSKVEGWENAAAARQEILSSVKRYDKK